MDLSELGLLGLALVGALASAGVWTVASGAALNLSIAERSAFDQSEDAAASLRARLDGRCRRTRFGRRLTARLEAAGVDLLAVDYLGLAATAALVSFVVVRALTSVVPALIAAAAVARGTWWWVQYKQRKRRDVFVAQLPEVARVLSNSASAGLAMSTALSLAAGELDDPAATEMRLMAESMRVGQSVEAALEELGRRLPSRELAVLVNTLVIQHRSGGGLVGALREMAETLEARKELKREIRTIMSGSVFTGYLVAAMGAGTLLVFNLISPGLLDKMLTSGVGQLALTISGALYGVGFLLIRKTVRIEP